MLQHLRPELSDDQAARATALLKRNLTESSDWIVLNNTMDALAEWAESNPPLADGSEASWSGCDGTGARRSPSGLRSTWRICRADRGQELAEPSVTARGSRTTTAVCCGRRAA